MRTLLDANVVLRYLLDDDEVMSSEAECIVRQSPTLLAEVACEVVYVLEGVYGVARSDLCSYLTGFIDEVKCPDGDVLKTALCIYKSMKKLDFVDCILAARKQVCGDDVATFDKKLKNRLVAIDETGSAVYKPSGKHK